MPTNKGRKEDAGYRKPWELWYQVNAMSFHGVHSKTSPKKRCKEECWQLGYSGVRTGLCALGWSGSLSEAQGRRKDYGIQRQWGHWPIEPPAQKAPPGSHPLTVSWQSPVPWEKLGSPLPSISELKGPSLKITWLFSMCFNPQPLLNKPHAKIRYIKQGEQNCSCSVERKGLSLHWQLPGVEPLGLFATQFATQ